MLGDITVPVTDEKGVTWTQYRTENMNPPKPIKDEIKKIWNNPNEGFGLIGLGLKKLSGGISSALVGGGLSSKIADEDFECNFKNVYSINNSAGIASKEKTDETSGEINIEDEVEEILNKRSGYIFIWEISYKEKDKTITCNAKYDTKEIIEFTIKLK